MGYFTIQSTLLVLKQEIVIVTNLFQFSPAAAVHSGITVNYRDVFVHSPRHCFSSLRNASRREGLAMAEEKTTSPPHGQ